MLSSVTLPAAAGTLERNTLSFKYYTFDCHFRQFRIFVNDKSFTLTFYTQRNPLELQQEVKKKFSLLHTVLVGDVFAVRNCFIFLGVGPLL